MKTVILKTGICALFATCTLIPPAEAAQNTAIGGIRNTDFESVQLNWKKPPKSKHPWTFRDAKRPYYWYYNENTPAEGEVRNDAPAKGKNYFRLHPEKGFVLLGQFFSKSLPKGVEKMNISLQVKGKGKVQLYISGKNAAKKKTRLVFQVNSPEKWFLLQGIIEVPENPNSFWIRYDGTTPLDIDDFQLKAISATAKK